jgi:hypothetical protein
MLTNWSLSIYAPDRPSQAGSPKPAFRLLEEKPISVDRKDAAQNKETRQDNFLILAAIQGNKGCRSRGIFPI